MIRLLMTTLLLAAPSQSVAQPSQAPATAQARQAQSAYVQGTLNLAAGERVVLRRSADGTFEQIEARFVGMEAALPPTEGSRARLEDIFQAEAGTIAFSLGARRNDASYLKIENALDQGFDYTGFIRRFRQGQAQEPTRTSVCSVPAGKLSFERWPEPVVQVVLANFRSSESAAPVCESHDINE